MKKKGIFNFILFLLIYNRFLFETQFNDPKLNFSEKFLFPVDFSRIPVTVSLVTSSLKAKESDQVTTEENLFLFFLILRILNFFGKSIRVKKQRIRGKLMYNFSFSICSLFGFFYYSFLTDVLLKVNNRTKESVKFNEFYEFDGKKIFSVTLNNFGEIFDLPLTIKGNFDGFLKIDFLISKNNNLVFFFNLKF